MENKYKISIINIKFHIVQKQSKGLLYKSRFSSPGCSESLSLGASGSDRGSSVLFQADSFMSAGRRTVPPQLAAELQETQKLKEFISSSKDPAYHSRKTFLIK